MCLFLFFSFFLPDLLYIILSVLNTRSLIFLYSQRMPVREGLSVRSIGS